MYLNVTDKVYLNGIVFRNSCEQIFKGPFFKGRIFLKKLAHDRARGSKGYGNFILGVSSEIGELYM